MGILELQKWGWCCQKSFSSSLTAVLMLGTLRLYFSRNSTMQTFLNQCQHNRIAGLPTKETLLWCRGQTGCWFGFLRRWLVLSCFSDRVLTLTLLHLYLPHMRHLQIHTKKAGSANTTNTLVKSVLSQHQSLYNILDKHNTNRDLWLEDKCMESMQISWLPSM
jgi:hypothetical protein